VKGRKRAGLCWEREGLCPICVSFGHGLAAFVVIGWALIKLITCDKVIYIFIFSCACAADAHLFVFFASQMRTCQHCWPCIMFLWLISCM
jgi:hypothetical protein